MATHIIEKKFDMVFSSDPANGAINIRDNGSSFEVAFNEPIMIPQEATNVELRVGNATIWWNVPNVTPGVNDIFQFAFMGGPVITANVPEGLYDLVGLQAALRTILINNGVPAAYAAQNFQLIPDNSTQRVIIYLGQAGDTINVGVAASVFQLAGFPFGSPPVTNPPLNTTAPETASFNQIDYFLIHTDLVTRGIRFNNNYNQTVAQVLINVPPGSQITYEPFNQPVCVAQELAGQHKYQAKFWLTDSRDRSVNTFGEYWTVRCTLSFLIPVFIR